MTSSNPIGSLPPLPPQQMSSILSDSSAVEALSGSIESQPLPGTDAFLDLSSDAVQLSASQQVEMAELEDDAALFGGSVGTSAFASFEPSSEPPAAPSWDPSTDVANPAYTDPGYGATDWEHDLSNPEFWA